MTRTTTPLLFPILDPVPTLPKSGKVLQGVAFFFGFSPFFSIAATNIFLFIFLSLWVVDLCKKKNVFNLHRTPFDIVLATYFFVWVGASLAGFSPLTSLMKIPVLHYPLLFYFLLFAYKGSLIPWVLCGVGVGGGVNVLYGWGQFITWQWIYDYPYGHVPEWVMNMPEKWRGYLTLSSGQGRIHGALHILTYSALLLPPFLYSGALILERSKPLVYIIAFWVTGGALILAAERGPFYGALLGSLLMILFHPRRLRLLGAVSLLILMLWFHPLFLSRLTGTPFNVPSEKLSSTVIGGAVSIKEGKKEKGDTFLAQKIKIIKQDHRILLWKGGFYIASRHPFLGVGPGQIGPVTALYNKNADFPPNSMGQEEDLHSLYIQRLVEMGFPGLVVSVWVILVFLKTGREFYRRRNSILPQFPVSRPESIRALALGVWALFLAYGVINLTERAYDDAEVSIVFWVLAATSVWFIRNSPLLGEVKFEGER
jgi:O-antigen ligase